MAFSVGAVFAELKGDITDFKAKMNEAKAITSDLSGKFKDVGSTLKSTGQQMSLMATTPLVALATGFVKLASDAEEINSKFDAVFKDGATTARNQFGDLAKTLGRSRTDLLNYGATLQDTFVPLGFARDVAADMSFNVVALSEDLASFNNLNTADVVRDIQSALVGNTETLRKYGVVASQDAIIQEALTSGLIDNKNELDATSKAQAIYQLLVKGTTDAQGDAERTAQSTANQMKALTSEFKALGEELGIIMIPIVQSLIAHLRIVIDWFRGLDEQQQKTILIIAAVVAAIGPLLIILGVLFSAIGTIITIGGVLIGVFGAFLAPIALVVVAIAGLAYAWSTNMFDIQNRTMAVWETIKSSFNLGVQMLQNVGGRIYDSIVKPFADAWGKVQELVNKIRDKLDFTKRQSPSVIDIINKGVKEANRAFESLEFDTNFTTRGAQVAAVGARGGGNGQIIINLPNATISSREAAQEYGERIGDSIIKKLHKSVRS